ncbi:MAG: Rap1a/Tai family immunity protein [Paracoccaceae bacterium]
MKLIVFVAALAMTLPRIAFAQNLDGNSLLEACESPAEQGLALFCSGYIMGVVEGLKWGSASTLVAIGTESSAAELNELSNNLLGYCTPPEAQFRQLQDIAINYLLAHPEQRHESARSMLLLAFRQAYPCPPL